MLRRIRQRTRGFILVAMSFSMVFLLGVLGLAIDIGRMYISKNEAQAYVDSASLAVAMQLDGTTAGITRANAAAGNDTDKWRFDTTPFTSVTKSYATSASGPFTTTPPSPPTGYTYVQVAVTANLPMYLIRPLVGSAALVSASAVAAGVPITSMPGGEFPFSPYTRAASPDNASDPFGYQIGNEYTLRWGAPGNNSSCGTDATSPNLSQNGKIRGYCCTSQSAASLRQAIVGGQTDPITIGQSVNMDNGAKDTEMTAIADRVNLDTDTTSTTYAQYQASRTGNGERVVVVPVNSGYPNYTALGYAAFFLETPGSYSGLGGNDSACALYIGAWTQGVAFPSGTGSGAYHIRILK
jgi:Flp pilus assembly protein TadG